MSMKLKLSKYLTPLLTLFFMGALFIMPHLAYGTDAMIDTSGSQTSSTTKAAAVEEAGERSLDDSNAISNFLGWILYYVAWFFSMLVSQLVKVLVYFAGYNNFLDHRIVLTGWQIVRDVCNNFFIVGLLVISVATILRQPASYQYQQALGKLLIMAVLINFSKLFTGILIDVSQVITIYFASALQASGENIILYALGLYGLYSTEPDADLQYGGFLLQLFLAIVLSVVAAVVVGAIVLVLVYRIVTLWFLVILSPAAFLAKAIPGQEKYFSEWFSTLSKELIVAPVMLFFLYLSLFAGAIDPTNPSSVSGVSGDTITKTSPSGTPNAALEPFAAAGQRDDSWKETLINFLLITGLLVGSLIAGQRVGAKGSSWAGAGVKKLDSMRKGTTKFGGRTAGYYAAKAPLAGLNRLSGGRFGSTLPGAWLSDITGKMDKDSTKRRLDLMKKVGMGDKTFNAIADNKKFLQDRRTQGAIAVAGGVATAGALAVGTGGLAPAAVLGSMVAAGLYARGVGKYTIAAAEGEAKDSKSGKRKANELNNTTATPATGIPGTPGYVPPGTRGLAAARSYWTKPGAYIGAGGVLAKDNKYLLDNIKSDGLYHQSKAIDGMTAGTDKNDTIDAFKKYLAAYQKGKGKNMSTVNAFLGNGAHNVLGVTSGELTALEPDVESPMVDIDPMKHELAKRRLAEFKKTNKKQFKGDEATEEAFWKSEGATELGYSREEYVENEAMRRHQRDNAGGMSVNKFARAKAGDLNEFSVDFKQLGVAGLEGKAGVHVTNQGQIKEIASAMSGVLAKEIAGLEGKTARTAGDNSRLEMMRQAQQRFARPEDLNSLQMYNTGRAGIGGKRLITHERSHAMLDQYDPNSELRQELWNSEHTEEERGAIRQQVMKQNRRTEMPETEVVNEYFAEGLANSGRFGDKSQNAIKMKAGVADKLQQQLGGSYQKQLIEGNLGAALKAEPEPEAAEAVRTVINNTTNIANAVKPGDQSGSMSQGFKGLFSGADYLTFRTTLMELNKSMKSINLNLRNQIGDLQHVISGLDQVLPTGQATPIEVKATLENAQIDPKDLERLMDIISPKT